MYKSGLFLLSAILFASVLARPHESEIPTASTPTIIQQSFDTNADGSYNSSYKTSNGIVAVNNGYIKTILVPDYDANDSIVIKEVDDYVPVQEGYYTFTDPEGRNVTVTYVADENGFHPSVHIN